MLAGVLLHVVEPAGPVDAPGDGLPNFHSLVAGVENDPVLLVDVGDGRASQSAVVCGLSAALGVKGSAVQHHFEAVFGLLTGQDRGGELLHEGVLIV